MSMNREVEAALGVGLALFAVYRATRRLEQAAEAYRRRGPRWDVIVPGALAVLILVSALADADAAISRARRAF